MLVFLMPSWRTRGSDGSRSMTRTWRTRSTMALLPAISPALVVWCTASTAAPVSRANASSGRITLFRTVATAVRLTGLDAESVSSTTRRAPPLVVDLAQPGQVGGHVERRPGRALAGVDDVGQVGPGGGQPVHGGGLRGVLQADED